MHAEPHAARHNSCGLVCQEGITPLPPHRAELPEADKRWFMSHAVNVGTNARGWSYSRPADHAYLILHIGFAALPIIAGLDKFFHRLVNWDMYLAPRAAQLIT